LIAYPLLGLSPTAAAIYASLAALAELAYHANVRTPRWVGFIVQRPEMHRIHHQRGVHAHNYADLPVWDFLFGTYENPATFEGECGFSPRDEARVGEMLAFVDVTADQVKEPSARPMLRKLGLAALFALGTASIFGTALEPFAPRVGKVISGIGKLSLASPYPKVFCRVKSAKADEEAFAFSHELEITYESGEHKAIAFDRARLAEVKGPYAYRNAYGASLAFAPHLPQATTEAVVRSGLCGAAPLLNDAERALGPVVRVTIRSAPRGHALGRARETEVTCASLSRSITGPSGACSWGSCSQHTLRCSCRTRRSLMAEAVSSRMLVSIHFPLGFGRRSVGMIHVR
jgi:hypothetical protein